MKNLKILLLLVLVVFTYCTHNDYSKELINFKNINDSLIEDYEMFLLIRSDYCTDCFQQIISNIEDKQKIEDILFVILGRNHKKIISFINNFPELQYVEEINPKLKRPIYPVLYFKSDNKINKIEIVSEKDLEQIINYDKNK